MVRTTIMLPEDLKRQVEALAGSAGKSLGEVIRDAVREKVSARRNQGADPFLSDRRTFRGRGSPHVAVEHDRHLAQALNKEMRRWDRPR